MPAAAKGFCLCFRRLISEELRGRMRAIGKVFTQPSQNGVIGTHGYVSADIVIGYVCVCLGC
jgi:hypothetical protein